MKELSIEQQNALRQIVGGADVGSYSLAKRLREIEKIAPEYIYITTVMGDYDVSEKRPYFGAITTKSGLEYLESKK